MLRVHTKHIETAPQAAVTSIKHLQATHGSRSLEAQRQNVDDKTKGYSAGCLTTLHGLYHTRVQ